MLRSYAMAIVSDTKWAIIRFRNIFGFSQRSNPSSLFALNIGKGNHALMSGHGKELGDLLFYPNRHRLGVISVSLQPPFQPTLTDNWCYMDVALARLDDQVDYIA